MFTLTIYFFLREWTDVCNYADDKTFHAFDLDLKSHITRLEHDATLDIRGGSRTAATSKMERFVIIVKGWKLLIIITKRSILAVAAVLDPPLDIEWFESIYMKLKQDKSYF